MLHPKEQMTMEPIIKITPFKKKPNMDCQIFCFDTYEDYCSLEYKAELVYGCNNCIKKLVSLLINNPEKRISDFI